MKILIACECSGIVRDAFLKKGHDVISCDLKPTERIGRHYQGDVLDILYDGWDMMIGFPDCTYLTCSAEWAYKDGPYHMKLNYETLVGALRRNAREKALLFVKKLLDAPIKKKCIENPRGVIGTRIRQADQWIQPYWFGEDASKITGLWLENLPKLVPTNRIKGRIVEWPKGSGKFVERWSNQTDSGQNKLTPSKNRAAKRAETYKGVADAMASQWG